MRKFSLVAGVAVLCLAVGSTASAVTIDFETFSNGEAGPFVISGVTITSGTGTNGTGPHLGAAIFDSSDPGPNDSGPDPDLLVNTGNILILQSTDSPGTSSGLFTTPNDEADGGTLIFDFATLVELTSINMVDINSNGPADLLLVDLQGDTRTYHVPTHWTNDISTQGGNGFQTLDLTTLLDQAPEDVVANPGAQPATATEDANFDADQVNQLIIEFYGSAAVDDLVFTATVPEPAGIGLLGFGLAGLIARRRLS